MRKKIQDGRRVVYVAGAYSADNVLDVLDNIKRGIATARSLLEKGASPFCPFIDFQYFLGENSITVEEIQSVGRDFVGRCDALVLVNNYQKNKLSKGTMAEIEHAMANQIPIFINEEDYLAWATGVGQICGKKQIGWPTGTFDVSVLSFEQLEAPCV